MSLERTRYEFGGIGLSLVWLMAGWVVSGLLGGPDVRGGNGSPAALVCFPLALAGTWLISPSVRSRVYWLAFGCFGAMPVLMLIVDASPSVPSHLLVAIAAFAIAAGGVACRMVAAVRIAAFCAKAERDHCASCGYALYGLRTSRCPECGQPFVGRYRPDPETVTAELVDSLSIARDNAAADEDVDARGYGL